MFVVNVKKKRGRKTLEHVDEIITDDKKWIETKFKLDQLRKQQNVVSKSIGKMKNETVIQTAGGQLIMTVTKKVAEREGTTPEKLAKVADMFKSPK